MLQLVEARATYRSLKIPMIVIPSTISNNVPGTDFSLGTDTSLNEIVSVSKLICVVAWTKPNRIATNPQRVSMYGWRIYGILLESFGVLLQ